MRAVYIRLKANTLIIGQAAAMYETIKELMPHGGVWVTAEDLDTAVDDYLELCSRVGAWG